MNKVKISLMVVAALGFGILIGGYVFRNVQPRSIIALNACNGTCLQSNELIGLVTSVGIQNLGAVIPFVVKETDKTIVLRHPFPQKRVHYVVIPKKDVKDIGSISSEDQAFLQDAFATMAKLINDEKLNSYRIVTNGPGYQEVTYLHFHLLSD